ncbi:MAG TPA: leucyl aminopeptidase [Anaeromyxobacteraceae bacterium]|jgi:leucyl aminopeptidase|nr:leucyl aminopeptidase [Anaeromyxobacteraceae bacterium]
MIKVELTGAAALELESNLLAVPVFEEELADGLKGPLVAIDRKLGGHVAAAAREEGFVGRSDQSLFLHTLGKMRSTRILFIGMGKRPTPEQLLRQGFESIRMAAGQAVRLARKTASARFAFAAASLPGDAALVARAVTEGTLLGAYQYDRYRTKKEKKADAPTQLLLALAPGKDRAADVKDLVTLAMEIADAVAWARDLVNAPPLACTPTLLADAARALAKEAGLAFEVKGPKEIAALKMGMFLGVARGSAEEPRLMRMSWIPKGAAAKKKPIVLVGKAITFDSGGLSLKPTDSMVTMKSDMAGSAAVFGAMKVIAALAPAQPVHALVGACENMPGGRAYKPSDILTSYDGKTVEITNTDAEGRLVLGDVLAWGADTLSPAAMVDVATLTGACVVALGHTTTGAFGPDGEVIEGVLAAGRNAGEDLWRMPLTESVKENLKSDVADMKNAGERWGGAISAAWFLREFVGDAPWAHLDIAGPSFSSKEAGYIAKGGTGAAVRTLVEFVRGFRG